MNDQQSFVDWRNSFLYGGDKNDFSTCKYLDLKENLESTFDDFPPRPRTILKYL